jgi:hypothetical protein
MSFLTSSVSTTFLSVITLAPTREETAARLQLEKIEKAFSDFVAIFPKEIQGLISEYFLSEWMLRLDPVTFKNGSVSFLTACRASKYMRPYIPSFNTTDSVQESLRLMGAVREEARYFEMPADESGDTLAAAEVIDRERIIIRTAFLVLLENPSLYVNLSLMTPQDRPQRINHLLSLPEMTVTILNDSPSTPFHGHQTGRYRPFAQWTTFKTNVFIHALPHVFKKMTNLEHLDFTCSESAANSLLPFIHNFKRLKTVIINTDPAPALIPVELEQLKRQNPACKIVWNGTTVKLEQASSICVIA